MSKPDRLSALIQRFRIEATVLPLLPKYSSQFAISDTSQSKLLPNLFVIGHGKLTLNKTSDNGAEYDSHHLIYCPRGLEVEDYTLEVDPDTEYVSAHVDTGGEFNPISLALPELVVIDLKQATALKNVTQMLLEESLSPRCGGQAVIDRLCEIVVIRMLRHLIEEGRATVGLVAGLAHINLASAIVAIHGNPEKNWNLEDLADVAAMSRTQFATTFRKVVGTTPGEYLSNWRLTLAHMELTKGTPLKAIVGKVGFSSSAALSRAFKRQFGISPKQQTSNSL